MCLSPESKFSNLHYKYVPIISHLNTRSVRRLYGFRYLEEDFLVAIEVAYEWLKFWVINLHTILTSAVNEVLLFMLYTKSHPFVRLWLLLHSRFVEAYYKNQTYENIFYLIHIPDRIIKASMFFMNCKIMLYETYFVSAIFCSQGLFHLYCRLHHSLFYLSLFFSAWKCSWEVLFF